MRTPEADDPSGAASDGSARTAPDGPPGGPRRAAVLGHPIAHSLSPALHTAAYAALGLTGWEYTVVDVTGEDLPGFLRGLGPQWVGLSLTMPLKKTVRPLLVSESPLAGAVGAVNTVVLGPQGPAGHNTDVPGIVEALRRAGIDRLGPQDAAVLGGGATAASAVAALKELGCDTPHVFVRSAARSADLLEACERLGCRPVLSDLGRAADGAADQGRPAVVVSTLPPGAADPLAPGLVRSLLGGGGPRGSAAVRASHDRPDGCAPGPVLLDVVYAPWPTLLAQVWQAAGGHVVGGFEMLLYQAVGQVELMTGLVPPVEPLRAAGERELSRRTP